MKEITFIITEDEVDGGYNAHARWTPGNRDIFTEADSREELIRNIRDAIDATFDKGDERPELVHLHFVRDEVIAL